MNEEQKAALLNNLRIVLIQPDGMSNLAKYVAKGEITIGELRATGQFSQDSEAKLMSLLDKIKNDIEQEKIREQEEKRKKEEEDFWTQCVTVNTVAMYENYLLRYPNGRYVQLAKHLIENWKDPQEKQKILGKLKTDINAFEPAYLSGKGIGIQDVLEHGIDVPERIVNIFDEEGINLDKGETPDSITPGRTEVYFWGTPGSGKTCTLAAVLRTAEEMGVFSPELCHGSIYMTQLKNVLLNGVGTLPPTTSLDVVQELAFNLSDEQKVSHPVTLIDIAGELFKNFTDEVNTRRASNLDSYVKLKNLLKSDSNPKFHFFIIEAHRDKISRNVDGYTQVDYLNWAMKFFTEKNIFNSRTSGIYVIITKSDILTTDESNRKTQAELFLKNNYPAFANALREIAIKKDVIRKGDPIPVIPFTIGKVYFKTKCIFNPETSKTVIRILQENVSKQLKPSKKGFLNW